jgi:hypothetical protein
MRIFYSKDEASLTRIEDQERLYTCGGFYFASKGLDIFVFTL